MSEGLAIFFWGAVFGFVFADGRTWWRARKPTEEHLVGAKIIEAGKDVLFTRSVTGADVIIRNISVLKIGRQRVSVTVSDPEAA